MSFGEFLCGIFVGEQYGRVLQMGVGKEEADIRQRWRDHVSAKANLATQSGSGAVSYGGPAWVAAGGRGFANGFAIMEERQGGTGLGNCRKLCSGCECFLSF